MDEALRTLTTRINYRDKNIVSILFYDVEQDTTLMPAYVAIAKKIEGKVLPCSDVISAIEQAFYEKYIESKSGGERITAINYVHTLADNLSRYLFPKQIRGTVKDIFCQRFPLGKADESSSEDRELVEA